MCSCGRCGPCYSRASYHRHRDKIRARRRRRETPNRERHPLNVKLAKMEYRARKRAARGFATAQQLLARWAYYAGLCWMCGCEADTWDHVVPLSDGGTAWPSNLRPACRSCNSRKGPRRV